MTREANISARQQQPCVRVLPLPPPCQHATIQKPCCPGCERHWYNAAMRQMDRQDRQRQREQERDAGS